MQADYRFAALVQPPNLLTQMALTDILTTQIGSWPCYGCFADGRAAQAWLAAQPCVA